VVLLSLPCQLGESFVERVGAHLRRLEQRCRAFIFVSGAFHLGIFFTLRVPFSATPQSVAALAT
jgi:hypothetical protein